MNVVCGALVAVSNNLCQFSVFKAIISLLYSLFSFLCFSCSLIFLYRFVFFLSVYPFFLVSFPFCVSFLISLFIFTSHNHYYTGKPEGKDILVMGTLLCIVTYWTFVKCHLLYIGPMSVAVGCVSDLW